MKIGLIVDNEYNNDPRVSNEAKALKNAGHQVRILCFNFGQYNTNEVVDGISVTRISISLKKKNWMFGFANTIGFYHRFWARNIKRFIHSEGIEAIHVADLYMARSGYLAIMNTSVKLIIDLKENYPAAVINYEWTKKFIKRIIARPKRWRKLEKKYLGYADRIVTMCDVLKEKLLARYDSLITENIFVYMNVPDVDFLLSQPIKNIGCESVGSYWVVYFGGIAKRRGIITGIEAIKKLRDNGDDVKLLLIGPIDTPEKSFFNKYFQSPEWNDFIVYIPWINLEDLPSFISPTNVGISPIVKSEQHDTTIANKMFQYSLFGKPIIASDCEPQMRIIEEDKSGLIFKSEDSDDLASKILYLKYNPEEAKIMGENGRRAVLEKYNLKVASKELIALYESLETNNSSL